MRAGRARYRTVLFDLDGTLVDSIPAVVNSFQEVFRRFAGATITADEVVALFGPPETEIIAAGVPPDRYPEALAAFYDRYGAATRRMGAYAGIRELLEGLTGAGCRLGVVTGKGQPTTDLTLERTGVAGFFRAVVSGHDVTRPKPDPAGIRMALQILGVGAEEAVYVGDMGDDSVAAGRAGAAFAGAAWDPRLRESLNKAGARMVFSSPTDLGKWLLA